MVISVILQDIWFNSEISFYIIKLCRVVHESLTTKNAYFIQKHDKTDCQANRTNSLIERVKTNDYAENLIQFSIE